MDGQVVLRGWVNVVVGFMGRLHWNLLNLYFGNLE